MRHYKIILLFIILTGCKANLDPQPLIFYVMGDWGTMGSSNQKAVAFRMNDWAQKENPKFIITTGDNFYPIGVADTKDIHWQESFEKIYNGVTIADKPWHVAVGNHDYLGSVDAEIEYNKINSRWVLPSRYYSFIETGIDGVRIRFIFIDTSPFEKSYYQDISLKKKISQQDTTKQKKWLDSLSALNDVDWKIVVGHHHFYTGGARKTDPNSVRTSLEPILSKNKVNIYFCGHEHDLQHLKSTNGPTHYLLSGAGGAAVRPTSLINESLFAASVPGFMSLLVNKKVLEVKIIDYNGSILHTATIEPIP